MRLGRSDPIAAPTGFPTTQIAVGGLMAAGAGLAVSNGQQSVVLAAGVALVGIFALLRWPAFTLLALLLVCEEVEAVPGGFGAGGSGLLFIGHQLYFKTVSRISLLTIVALAGCVRVALVNAPNRIRSASLLIALLIGFWYGATVWLDGSALTSAINQDARFALLFVLTYMIGAAAADQADWKARSIPLMQWALSIMALIGAYLEATGQGGGTGGVNVIFYDSALGSAAGAVILAVALAPRAARTPRAWWLAAAAFVVVVLSSRRNVWAAMILALLAGLVVARQRTRLVVRGLVGAVAVLVVLGVVAPTVLTEIGHQFSAIWQATQGSAADTSAQGHLSDISVGIKAILAHPIGGLGAGGHLPGLVVETPGSLYIHNQILESWLRFGVVGGLLVIALQIALFVQGVRVLRTSADDISRTWAALLLVMAPAAFLTAPFLTETQRWPALIGFAAGLTAARRLPGTAAVPPPALRARAGRTQPVLRGRA